MSKDIQVFLAIVLVMIIIYLLYRYKEESSAKKNIDLTINTRIYKMREDWSYIPIVASPAPVNLLIYKDPNAKIAPIWFKKGETFSGTEVGSFIETTKENNKVQVPKDKVENIDINTRIS